MSRVYLSLGSNINRYRHIAAALDALAEEFGRLDISTVYESESVGFNGRNFLNLVVGVRTGLAVGELSAKLKKIENDNGRNRQGPKFSPRTLDIDILTVDNVVGMVDGVELPRDEITKNAFVLLPMAELAPDEFHPRLGRSYAQLWQDYDQHSQKLWPVSFVWRSQEISVAQE